jgi:hypothetical protein
VTTRQIANPAATAAKVKPCYGVECPKRQRCAAFVRRWPVEGAIASCRVGEGDTEAWPLFVQVQEMP